MLHMCQGASLKSLKVKSKREKFRCMSGSQLQEIKACIAKLTPISLLKREDNA